jgi:hypothetical protein
MSRTFGHAWGGRDPHDDGTHRHTRRLRPAGRDQAAFDADLDLDEPVPDEGLLLLAIRPVRFLLPS